MQKLGEIEIKRQKTGEKNERTELLRYFFEKLSPTWTKGKLTGGLLGMRTHHLKLHDLKYIKSICEDSERRGGEFHVTFWGSLKAK